MILLSNDLGLVGMRAGAESLQKSESCVDAVQAGVERVEADRLIRYVGFGGDPNALGEVECDAAIMRGSDRNAGAVGALRGHMHAIRVARRVMDDLPHVMLVGEGADRFAREVGEEPVDMLSAEARERYDQWLRQQLSDAEREAWPDIDLARLSWSAAARDEPKGTTVFLARDAAKDIAAATSTSGWMYKYPGRLGDSPIIGAGLYAHNAAGACGCTHTGEMTIRANTAATVVRALQRGVSLRDACFEAHRDLCELENGVLGPVVIHA
ncbi:MAG: beta-aspartyl-peptidase (threonine type), partial [Planctomycetota bacterium]